MNMIHEQHDGIIREIEAHWTAFALSFLGIFTIVFVSFLLLDFVPDSMSVAPHVDTSTATTSQQTSSSPTTGDTSGLPIRISINAISLKADISNPATTSVSVLDEALLRGAVRYPTSASLGQEGTVLLFGHSSYLPIVHNQAYKAFDGIQNLHVGDSISVYSAGNEYRYSVTGVRTANVGDADTNTIELPRTGKHLILITCDSFGTKSDRFVVSADLEGVHPGA